MKTKIIQFVGIAVISFAILGFINKPIALNKKDIENPLERIILPEILHEISGLTDLGPTTIACVQDELGVVFIYDFIQQKITTSFRFAEDGDYEGITKVENKIYVLRSDGALFEIEYQNDNKIDVQIIETRIAAANNEALCYDEKNKRLLIGSKVKSGKGSNNNERHIHSFNLNAKTIEDEPAFTLNKNEIIEFATNNNVRLPSKENKKSGKSSINIKLGVSGISIHPKTQDLYVLCAIDYLFLIYNSAGELKDLKLLDKKRYPQAEGITFYENGELFISNEGQNGQPTLIRFKDS